jgi:hypothetical protein
MSAVLRLRSITVALIAMSLVSCVTHIQDEGRYAFTVQEVLSDDCGILGSPPALWAGTLYVRGETLFLDYEFFGIQLRGEYQEASESFYLDGSASNLTATVGSEECRVDLVQLHIDGTTQSTSTFEGTLAIRYDVLLRERCRCEVLVRYAAELVPAPLP